MSVKYFNDLNIKFEDDKKSYAKVSVEPFDRGYAVTVGNALRRTLLTTLPGAAITSIKIDGVSHEFSTIKGVSEDLPDIILNFKKIRFKMNDDVTSELISFKLNYDNAGVFKAEELNKYLDDFSVINGSLPIMTFNKKTSLEIEIRVSRGKGYVGSESNKRSDDTLGTIAVDSIFNPVLNVAWEVIPIPASTEGQERLLLEVDTDGSTSAKDCINHAASILIQHLSFFMFDDATRIKAIDNEEANQAIEIKATLLKSIDEMELSVRSHNCLQAAGIHQISDLVSKDESEMLKFKNFGRKSLTELNEKLGELNLKFGMDISQFMKD
ncbi:MAG: DNA-directed RNA polymerase subunit alpha [Candidatus Marinimicrobia bacterium]|nr:DNA-directed RNA polymerase subunit alpha [Candidatus Neomarinimicrobiota bacterium]|tara:strand:- start:38534 stop:39508 length:975 start_codon:yes stop_codon:yes gene_type:complete